jgi:thiamine biosynthesis lipoprotein
MAGFLFITLCWVWPNTVFPALHEVREIHYQMGTFLDLTLWHSEPELAKRMIREAAQEVHRLEQILSNFDPDSPVSRLNQKAGNGKMGVPAELYKVLELAQQFSDRTAGDFDVTVGALMDLWRESSLLMRLPGQSELVRVLRQVGYNKLKLYKSGKAELLVTGMKIDLGGIGKGYAVDRVADLFKRAGVSAALINFGGSSIYALGVPPGAGGWEIGLQGIDGRVRGLILLRDMALSTSGSMGKFWTIDTKRYGHMIDPNNGMPVSESRLATVIAPTATAAEALTKPLVLRGKKALPIIALSPETEAVVFSEHGALLFSVGFKSKIRWQEIPHP